MNLIPDMPGYLVVVGENGKEWARRKVTASFRLDPFTRDITVTAPFKPFEVQPLVKKRETSRFRIDYRNMADDLVMRGDWNPHAVGRRDKVLINP